MLILTSPAKTLDFESKIPRLSTTSPLFEKEADIIAHTLSKYSVKMLSKKLSVSTKIAELNFERYANWDTTPERAALFAYYGDVFRQMNPRSYSEKELLYTQKTLRIISGIYGIVRPLDVIKPYRLEMKSKIKIQKKNNLYDFWKERLTSYLNEDIKANKHHFVLNLASVEYSKAIDLKKLIAPVVTIDFNQISKEKIRNFGLLSKYARGLMIEFCIKNTIETLDEVKQFSEKRYQLQKETNNNFLFIQS